MYGVGIMSGTSLDGVDTVLVKLDGYGKNTKLEVIAYHEYPLSEAIQERIKKACDKETSSSDLICSLNFELGYLFSDAVKILLNKTNFSSQKIDFIASHGQTIYHIPQSSNAYIPSTLQIGEPAIIAYQLDTTVISNFRVMDMAAGGQGAPLVPYSEYILYSQKDKTIALQNIGGIGNVTVLPASQDMDEIFAFDTGPGNMMINEACQILYNLPYDQDGKIASIGSVNEELLAHLMKHPYFQLPIPKSTGREEFGQFYVRELLQQFHSIIPEDMIATLTMFTAKSIHFHYQRDILKNTSIDEIVIGGGGAHNKTLVTFIKDLLAPIPVYTQEEKGFSSDAKEAIAFAVMGNETLHQHFSNVKNATGAKEYVVLGNITPVPLGGRNNGK